MNEQMTVIEQKVLSLKDRAEALSVTNQPTYITACEIVKAGRAEIKAIGFVLDPGIQSARDHLDKLRGDKQKYVGQVEPVVKLAEQKAETWIRAEKAAAAKEQDRINEAARKEAERVNEAARKEAAARHIKRPEPVVSVPIVVAPSVPIVAGIRKQMLWKFRITDETKIPRMYCMPNEVEIGRMVRTTKDKAKAEALIPGIEVFNEESI